MGISTAFIILSAYRACEVCPVYIYRPLLSNRSIKAVKIMSLLWGSAPQMGLA
jgi:hypothetical protein